MLKYNKGFTLIEILIAIAIISIISAIAIPSYSSHIVESRRNAVKQVLLKATNLLENCYSLNHSYQGCFGSGTTNNLASLLASEKLSDYYVDSGTSITASDYVLIVSANNGQKRDKKCLSLLINRQGIKASSATSAIESSATTDLNKCW